MTGITTTIKAPTAILDTNSNEVIKFTGVASAVNEFTFTNAVNGGSPLIQASGDSADIELYFACKGVAVTSFRGSGSFNAGVKYWNYI